MNKLLVTLFLCFFSTVLMAEGSLSFAPPPGDYSVLFLGNLFGVVDGVLSGTGSQIMGSMFAVFNSAVLALGGMIIMYTLMVSTMNTAHEGQVLGQKWSSIWIPVRSTLGLALLIPKASGYCMMQIFVMWVVVQGVGAADKVWEAALSYLNRGGVIIQAQANPTLAMTNPDSANSGIASGASAILVGQVCMLGLQNQLEARRKALLDTKQTSTGGCSGNKVDPRFKAICNSSIPDFIGSVNMVQAQDEAVSSAIALRATNPSVTMPRTFTVTMPAFKTGTPFAFLNGICGSITWNALPNPANPKQTMNDITASPGVNANIGGASDTEMAQLSAIAKVTGIDFTSDVKGVTISASELQTVQLSRAIAIQQMYMDLSSVAQVMVNNDPLLASTSTMGTTNNNFSLNAKQQFGVPYTSAGELCKSYGDTCVSWGPEFSGGVLFAGTEFLGAISAYNAVMTPTLNLMAAAGESKNANSSRAFMAAAKTQGWIMAGSYFFDLVKLNGNAMGSAVKDPMGYTMGYQQKMDTNTGLTSSKASFSGMDGTQCNTQLYPTLCDWFEGDTKSLMNIQSLIDGTYAISPTLPGTAQPPPKVGANDIAQNTAAINSTSVNGFINNSVMIQMPGQPGTNQLEFAGMIHFNLDAKNYKLPDANFDCGGIDFGLFEICVGRMLGELFYNAIFKQIYNFFFAALASIVNQFIMVFLMVPLAGIAGIFKQGIQTISTPGVNPVVALANMGVNYINFASNLWFLLLTLSVGTAPFGPFIFTIIALALPLIMAWLGIMVSVGFITAYYIPVLPYMIFTFGSLAWLISVIEAMVAAPIVALGVTHPEGHDAFGKAEAAIMLLMNIFLRPSLMIIGYISGIALCYVGVWILNAGFDHAIGFIQNGATESLTKASSYVKAGAWTGGTNRTSGTGGYSDWAGIYAYFFSVLIYTATYLAIVQQAFTLISVLPDKVLRWIGGTPESIGQESIKWGEEAKGKISEAGKGTADAQGQIGSKLGAYGEKKAGTNKGGGKAKFHGNGNSTPESPG